MLIEARLIKVGDFIPNFGTVRNIKSFGSSTASPRANREVEVPKGTPHKAKMALIAAGEEQAAYFVPCPVSVTFDNGTQTKSLKLDAKVEVYQLKRVA